VLKAKGAGKFDLVSASAGVRQYGSNNKVSDSDIWHLGSCSKMMTATLTAVLICKKLIPGGWEATLRDVCSAAKTFQPTTFHEAWGGVTLRQLLSHHAFFTTNPTVEAW